MYAWKNSTFDWVNWIITMMNFLPH
jgi:hypothetical protein